MDMSVVASLVAMQAANSRQQIAASVLKMNLQSQANVLKLLEPAASAPAANNNAAGVGGNLDISV
jgi:hypothetical protein